MNNIIKFVPRHLLKKNIKPAFPLDAHLINHRLDEVAAQMLREGVELNEENTQRAMNYLKLQANETTGVQG